MLEIDFEQFVSELDAAVQAHLEWSRRVFRCAVLRTSPGDDALTSEAHTLCRFGCWFERHRGDFEALDADRTGCLEAQHQAMHDAIRAICSRVLEGTTGEAADLDVFEANQYQIIDHLAHFKTLAITRGLRIDALTGLPLRHRIEQDFGLLTAHSRRRSGVLVLMMADVDHFKAVNDQHGHAAGDTVLQHLGATLRRALRDDDFVYRYGGEEFVLLMELGAAEDAEVAAGRVLEAVRRLSVALPDDAIVRPTVTLGVAMVAEGESLASVIQRSDAALYEGKAAGRNCYVVAAEPDSSGDVHP